MFALSFDDFVLSFFTTGESPQPLPVRIWSAIRFGVSPTINAIGTLDAGDLAVLRSGWRCCCRGCSGASESGLGVLTGRRGRMSEPAVALRAA